MIKLRKCQIGVIGLGYVGLPLAVEFGKHFDTKGFDLKAARIAELRAGRDSTLEVSAGELAAATHLSFSTDLQTLKTCGAYIVTVPTPIDAYKRPDLSPLTGASASVGKVLKKGDVVVYESTVYPGCTEEVCVPILERESGLKFNRQFSVGYSPERINPGDKDHRLTTIKKVTSGSTPEAAEFVDALYRSIITAGTHGASSIKVADVVRELQKYGADVDVYDPWADAAECQHEYGLPLTRALPKKTYAPAVLAVAHREFRDLGAAQVHRLCRKNHVLYDIKHMFPAAEVDGRL